MTTMKTATLLIPALFLAASSFSFASTILSDTFTGATFDNGSSGPVFDNLSWCGEVFVVYFHPG